MLIHYRFACIALFSVFLTACSGGNNEGDDNPPMDTTPDPFSFTDSEPYFPQTVVVSSPVSISGIDAATSVSVTGGEYAIGNGDFTSSAGSVTDGQQVRLRGITGTEAGGSAVITLTVGGVEGGFRILTVSSDVPSDTSPASFQFPAPDSSTVSPGATIVSDPIVVEEINAASPVSVNGGEYRINDGEWTDAPGVVNPGDVVEVRGTAPSTSNSVTEVVLTIGDVSEVFSIVTAPAAGETDTVPDPVNVTELDTSVDDPNAVMPGEAVTFGPIPVSGLDGETSIDIGSPGEFSLDGGATWFSAEDAAPAVTDGASVLVRVPASDFPGRRNEAQLIIGGVTTVFAVTTASAPYGNDVSPDPVDAPLPATATIGEPVIFTPVLVTGTDAPTTITLSNDPGVTAEFRIDGGAWLPAGTNVAMVAGQTVEVRLTADSDAGASAAAELVIGDQTVSYTLNIPAGDNRSPVADAGTTQSVFVGDQVTLNGGNSSDLDDDELSFQWTQTDNTGIAIELTGDRTATPTFTAPEVTESTTFIFELAVSDGEFESSDSVNITVAPAGSTNRAPNADAGAPQSLDEGSNVTVTLDGSNSTDPDGDELTFLWEQVDTTQHRVTLDDASAAIASFTVPNVLEDTVLQFRLTVSDGTLSATNTSSVTIQFVNQAPQADAGADQIINEGVEVTLNGLANDPDGDAFSFAWTQVSGPEVNLSAADTSSAQFTAPAVSVDTQLVFRLTVTDSRDFSASDNVTITVRDTNRAPVAHAGNNRSVTEGNAVTLDGSASSDLDGDLLTFNWTQTDDSGVAVDLNDADTMQATFNAPAVDETITLTFTLAVSDGAKSSSDTVDITVSPQDALNQSPQADAGIDQIVDEGTVVNLDGNNSSDPENRPLTYSWTRIDSNGVPGSVDDPASASTTFTAPDVVADQVFTFRLTVTDDGDLQNSDTVNITVSNVNHAPVADAGEDIAVDEGSTFTLEGRGTDIDNDDLDFNWTVPAGFATGPTNGQSLNVQSTPDVDADTEYGFTLRVTDSQGDFHTDEVKATVRFVNRAPQVTVGGPYLVDEGGSLTLNGNATDLDGDGLDYFWTVPGGFAATGQETASLVITATPDVTVDTDYNFTLTATDTHGDSASATATVKVRFVNREPTVDAGGAATVNPGTLVTLNGSANDVDGGTLTTLWEQTSGETVTLSDPAALQPTFTAPALIGGDDLVFRLTVTDEDDASASATVTITVAEADVSPADFTFTPVADAEPGSEHSVQMSVTEVDAGVNIPVSMSGDTDYATLTVAGEQLAGISGSAQLDDAVSISLTADDPGNSRSVTLNVGGKTATFTVTTRAPDYTPVFQSTFTGYPKNNEVDLGIQLDSNAVTVTGFDGPMEIQLGGHAGGEYRITHNSVTGIWIAGNTRNDIYPGDSIEIRMTTPSTFETSKTHSLAIYEPDATASVANEVWSVYTRYDNEPDAFTLTDLTNIEPSSTDNVGQMTVAGIHANALATASISGADAAHAVLVVNGADQAGTSAEVALGDAVGVRLTASSEFSTDRTVRLSIGEQYDELTVTTRAIDQLPDSYSFTTLSDVEPGQEYLSGEVVLSGFDGTLYFRTAITQYSNPTAASGVTYFRVKPADSTAWGEWVLNGNTNAKPVRAGDSVQLKATSNTVFSGRSHSNSSIANEAGSAVKTNAWVINVRAQDTTPDGFGDFTGATGIEPGAIVTSDPQTLAVDSFDGPLAVTATNGLVSVSSNGTDWSAFAATGLEVNPGDQVKVQVTSSPDADGTVSSTVTVGSLSGSFTATTRDYVPDSIDGAFVDQTDVDPNDTVESNEVVLSGFEGDLVIVLSGHATTERAYRVKKADTAVWEDWITPPSNTQSSILQSGDTVQLRRIADSVYESTLFTTFYLRIPDKAGNIASDQWTVKTRAFDTTPDGFGDFAAQTGINPEAIVTSDPQTLAVDSFDGPLAVTATNGLVSVSSNGTDWSAFAATGLEVNPGDQVKIQVTASADWETETVATVTIGTLSGSFSVETRAQDTTPDGFGDFAGQTGVDPEAIVTSDPQTLAADSFDGPLAVTATNGLVSVSSNGTDWSAFAATGLEVNPGDQVKVQVTASADWETDTVATVTIGTLSGSFSATTRAQDTTPDGISQFSVETGVEPEIEVTSNAQTLAAGSFDGPLTATVTNGLVSVSSNGTDWSAFVATADVNPGDQVKLQVTSADWSGSVTATVTIGSITSNFVVTTRAQDTTPDGFGDFVGKTGIDPEAEVTSDPQTLAVDSFDGPLAVTATNGLVSVSSNGTDWSAFAATGLEVNPGDQVKVQVAASADWETETVATVTIGTLSGNFSVTTRDATPDGFGDFAGVTGVDPEAEVTSDPQTLAVDSFDGPLAVTATNGLVSVSSNGTDWSAFATTGLEVSPGDQVKVQVTASVDWETETVATVTIGTLSGTFSVETRAPVTVPDAFGWDAVEGVEPDSSLHESDAVQITGLEVQADISVTGTNASYRVLDTDGTSEVVGWTSGTNTIQPNQYVQARVEVSESFDSTRSATVTIGGVNATYSVTTREGDTTPENFTSIGPDQSAAINSTVYFGPITIGDIDSDVALFSVVTDNGTTVEYKLDANMDNAFKPWIDGSSANELLNNQVLWIRLTAPEPADTATVVTATAGTVSVSATVTSVAEGEDATPDPFVFTPATDAERNALVISNTVNLTGYDAAGLTLSTSGGLEFDLGDGTWLTSTSDVTPGTVRVRLTSANAFDTESVGSLTIGDYTAEFSVTTRAEDTLAELSDFTNTTDVLINSTGHKSSTTVSGIDNAQPVSISGDASAIYHINGIGPYDADWDANNPGVNKVDVGDVVEVTLSASGSFSTPVSATIAVGEGENAVTKTFTVTTEARDVTPDDFDLVDVENADHWTSYYATYTVAGINDTADVAIATSDSAYFRILDADTGTWGITTTGPGTIEVGDTIEVKLVSANSGYSAVTSVDVTIGDATTTFSVTTEPDVTDPAGEILFPLTDNAQTDADMLRVSGVATDNGDLESVTVRYLEASQSVIATLDTESGEWYADIPLEIGETDFGARIVDAAGNAYDTSSQNVRRVDAFWKNPVDIAWHPDRGDSGEIYAFDNKLGEVHIVDVSTGVSRYMGNRIVPMGGQFDPVIDRAGLALDRVNNRLFVAGTNLWGGGRALRVIDLDTETGIDIGGRGTGVTIPADIADIAYDAVNQRVIWLMKDGELYTTDVSADPIDGLPVGDRTLLSDTSGAFGGEPAFTTDSYRSVAVDPGTPFIYTYESRGSNEGDGRLVRVLPDTGARTTLVGPCTAAASCELTAGVDDDLDGIVGNGNDELLTGDDVHLFFTSDSTGDPSALVNSENGEFAVLTIEPIDGNTRTVLSSTDMTGDVPGYIASVASDGSDNWAFLAENAADGRRFRLVTRDTGSTTGVTLRAADPIPEGDFTTAPLFGTAIMVAPDHRTIYYQYSSGGGLATANLVTGVRRDLGDETARVGDEIGFASETAYINGLSFVSTRKASTLENHLVIMHHDGDSDFVRKIWDTNIDTCTGDAGPVPVTNSSGLAVTSDGNYVYFHSGARIIELDIADLDNVSCRVVVDDLNLNADFMSRTVDEVNNRIFVRTNSLLGQFYAIDLLTGAVVELTRTGPNNGGDGSGPTFPGILAVSGSYHAATGRWTAAYRNSLYGLDVATEERILVADSTSDVPLTGFGPKIYSTLGGQHAIDPQTGALLVFDRMLHALYQVDWESGDRVLITRW